MKNSLIVKSNQLIQARYELSLNEQKIILYAASKIDRELNNFNYIELDINDFTDLLETKGKRYDEIRETVRELRTKEIIINTDEKEFITGWLSSITFYKNTGKIKLRFDDDLIPFLLQLKERFTRYQLKNILNLKSKYSIRLYELMKQYEFRKQKEFKLEELKKILFIEDKYDRVYDLEKYILKVAKQEINKHTDINIDYEKIKTGRRITSILFTIESKDQEREIYIEYLNKNYKIKEMQREMGLSNENFNSKQIINIYELAVKKLENEEEKNIFEYIRLNYLHIRDKARNKYSYLMKALENDYAVAAAQIKLDYYI